MSLVTNPRSIVIENGDLFDDSSDEEVGVEEGRLLAALREIRGVSLHGVGNTLEAAERGSSQRPAAAAQQRRPRQEQAEAEAPQKQARRPKPRRFDPKALERLNVSTAASRARSQKKYVDQLKEKKAQKKPHAPRAVSPTATRAGLRLYAAAMGCKKRREDRQVEQERLQKECEEKMTFQPQISLFAKQLGNAGCAPLLERLEYTREKFAKNALLRERERMDRAMAGCTFHPTLAATSRKMTAMRRKSEPFNDAGERLFFEGGRRLIRQQLRERILEEAFDNGVIGDFQISNDAAEALALRLWNWQENADRHREAARREHVQGVTRPSPSKFRRVPQTQRGQHRSCNHIRHSSATSSSPPASEHKVPQHLPEDELREIRCRALFSKYASSENSASVHLAEVKRQVRELFPEDSGIVVALAASFSDADEISKTAFVESLMRFEQLNGPQPWGNPKWAHVTSVADEPPLLLSASSSLAPRRVEAAATLPGNLQRSNSAHATPLARKQKAGKKDDVPSSSSSDRRASSLTLGRRSSGGASNGLQSCGPCPRQHERHVTPSTALQEVRRRTAERAASEPGRRSPERHETMLRQRREELLARQRSIPREVSNAHEAQERSWSPGSVEVSSITEEGGSTPSAKRPEEIVAELEALIATPSKRSATASPTRPSKRHGSASHGGEVSSLSTSLRRRAQNVSIPGSTRGVDYSTAKQRHLTRQKILKEVEQVLGAGTVFVAID
ncbi:uncharacterized protein Tco025E_03658 [Trypanosoma conorhini]|uniref:Uncharacterized protein n=1 Tax=Trypanosoma conorhini TaxID=83891 RepID=A0A3R7L468_9TRYP|nr:uncharacterized protein Tco025E_03658 [Trypanosoma conorhini]RNF20750.1 hypothetical protein Tco025E_03658 [Trypanosoma conorhini]